MTSPTTIQVQVSLKSSAGAEQRGTVVIETWDTQTCWKRALKSLGIFWGLAIVSVFIPMLHFFLVPGFLVAGPIVSFFTFNQKSRVRGGQSLCPKCQAPFLIVSNKDQWPLKDVCGKCFENVLIQKS